jgi:N utilization substance protein B
MFKFYESRCCMTRREAREEALILVFEKQFNSDSIEDIIETAKEVRDIEPDEYILEVFKGVYDNLEFIDGVISKYSQGWSINRITKISLAVLRLAIYEMKFVDAIPVSVSINEAVELAKKYSTKEDSAYINGILSSVSKED